MGLSQSRDYFKEMQPMRGHNRPFIGTAGVVPRLYTFHSSHLPQPQPAGVAACHQAVPSTQQHTLAKNSNAELNTQRGYVS